MGMEVVWLFCLNMLQRASPHLPVDKQALSGMALRVLSALKGAGKAEQIAPSDLKASLLLLACFPWPSKKWESP